MFVLTTNMTFQLTPEVHQKMMIEKARRMLVKRFLSGQLEDAKLELKRMAKLRDDVNVENLDEDWMPEMSTCSLNVKCPIKFGDVYFSIIDIRIPYLIRVIVALNEMHNNDNEICQWVKPRLRNIGEGSVCLCSGGNVDKLLDDGMDIVEMLIGWKSSNEKEIPKIIREYEYLCGGGCHEYDWYTMDVGFDLSSGIRKQIMHDIGKFVDKQRMTFLLGGMICDEDDEDECPIGMLCADLREEIVNMF